MADPTWDLDMTLESPSFNDVAVGTQIRLSVENWEEEYVDKDPAAAPVGAGKKPVKAANGMYLRQVTLKGQITEAFAKDTKVWNYTDSGGVMHPTVVNGNVITSLPNGWILRDLINSAMTDWWSEAAAGNWHDDGMPPRATGLARLLFSYRSTDFNSPGGLTGSTKLNYIYGKVVYVHFSARNAAVKAGRVFDYEVVFQEADVEA